MSSFQQEKLTKPTMKQENMAQSKGKNWQKIIPEEAHSLELLDKDIKSTTLNMLKKLKETMPKE